MLKLTENTTLDLNQCLEYISSNLDKTCFITYDWGSGECSLKIFNLSEPGGSITIDQLEYSTFNDLVNNEVIHLQSTYKQEKNYVPNKENLKKFCVKLKMKETFDIKSY